MSAKGKPLFVTFTKTPPAICPRCQTTLRSVSGLGTRGPARPAPGDVTLCEQCHTWLAFTDGMSLRLATAAEIEALPGELRTVAQRIAEWVGGADRKD